MTSETDYSNASQERLLAVFHALMGHEFQGVLPSEIAAAAKTSASNVTRDLRVLAAAGFAEPVPGAKTWRYGPKVVQIAHAFEQAAADALRRLQETEQRFTRQPD